MTTPSDVAYSKRIPPAPARSVCKHMLRRAREEADEAAHGSAKLPMQRTWDWADDVTSPLPAATCGKAGSGIRRHLPLSEARGAHGPACLFGITTMGRKGALTDWAGSRVALAVGGADAEPVLRSRLELVNHRERLWTGVHLREVDVRLRLALALRMHKITPLPGTSGCLVAWSRRRLAGVRM
jgi:hypothetical protein